MSTTTLVSLKAAKLHEGRLSSTPTPARGSLDSARQTDPEKLPQEDHHESDGEEPPPLSTLRMSLLVMGLTLSIFLVALDFNIITTAIPRITDEFQSLNSVAWYGAAFFLTTSSLQGPWGKIYKFFHLKWTIMTALLIFEIGSLMCGVAQNNTTLVVGRAIQGIGASGLQNGTYTIVGVILPRRQRPAFTGVLGAMFGITCVIGPLLGGALTDNVTWRWCFYINLPLGGAVALTLLLSMKTPKKGDEMKGMTWREIVLQMDPLGVVLLVSATVCILLALQWGGIQQTWGSSQVVGCIVGFVLLFGLFVADQWYMKEKASYPFRILKGRNVAVGVAWNLLMGGAFILHMYLLPLYFQSVRGASPTSSGIRLLPLILAMTITSMGGAAFITAKGMPMQIMFAGAVMATVGSGLVYTFDVETPFGNWVGYLVLLGLGYGFTLQLAIIVGQASSKLEDIAVTTAAINFTQTYGGAIAVSVAQSIFSNKLVSGVLTQVPGVDPSVVINAGATNLKENLTVEQFTLVLQIFMNSLRDAFILPIGLAGISVFLALMLTREMRTVGGMKMPSM